MCTFGCTLSDYTSVSLSTQDSKSGRVRGVTRCTRLRVLALKTTLLCYKLWYIQNISVLTTISVYAVPISKSDL